MQPHDAAQIREVDAHLQFSTFGRSTDPHEQMFDLVSAVGVLTNVSQGNVHREWMMKVDCNLTSSGGDLTLVRSW